MSISITKYTIIGLIIIIICVFLWIKEKITLHYKDLLAKDTIDNLQNKLDEQINMNKTLQSELNKISAVNHKFSSRISALELYVSKLSTTSNSKITNSKYVEAQNLIKGLSCEFSDEMQINLKDNSEIHKTGIINIDNILEYFKSECFTKNIKFDIIVKSNIESIVEKFVPLNLLETLISDMLNNAIIAISYSSNKSPRILIQFDNKSDYFELRIYDTGINFEINTFEKLGKERITTHKDTGGSGIGLYTTFETISKTNGSFIIEEYNQFESEFSKCLIFKFDSKNNYTIKSYRYSEIKENINFKNSKFNFEKISIKS